MNRKINPCRRPATMADVQRAKETATADACRVTLAIFFTALLDKEGMDAEQLHRIWREVEALSESVRDGNFGERRDSLCFTHEFSSGERKHGRRRKNGKIRSEAAAHGWLLPGGSGRAGAPVHAVGNGDAVYP